MADKSILNLSKFAVTVSSTTQNTMPAAFPEHSTGSGTRKRNSRNVSSARKIYLIFKINSP
jgi:hypothetical protein